MVELGWTWSQIMDTPVREIELVLAYYHRRTQQQNGV